MSSGNPLVRVTAVKTTSAIYQASYTIGSGLARFAITVYESFNLVRESGENRTGDRVSRQRSCTVAVSKRVGVYLGQLQRVPFTSITGRDNSNKKKKKNTKKGHVAAITNVPSRINAYSCTRRKINFGP